MLKKYYKYNNKKLKGKKFFKRTGLIVPQMKGIVTKVFTMTPKKPNSALRKIVKVKTNLKKILLVYVPGEKHTLSVHNEVLIRNNRIQDMPGINYEIIRGKLDAKSPIRVTSRSKYGIKKNTPKKN